MEVGHYWVRSDVEHAWYVAYLDDRGNWYIPGNEESQPTPEIIHLPMLEEPEDT